MKVLEINKSDLIHNIKVIKNLVKSENKDIPKTEKQCQVIAVVKGNGYGMGLVEYVKILRDQGVEFFAVSTWEEALEIRKAGIKEKILMLSPTIIKKEVEELVENNINLTISSKESAQIANLVAKEKNKTIKIHIKIDTGFGRYGFMYDKPLDIIDVIKNNQNLEIEGCYSHFSESYAKTNKWTSIQYERFLNTIENLQLNKIKTGILHICNSSALLKYPYMKLNAVRIGSAFTGRILTNNTFGLKKIGKIKTNISEIKTLPKNYNIGYSNTYTTKQETKVAIATIGYSDGLNMGINNDSFRLIDHMRYIYNDIKNIFKDKNIYVKIKGKQYEIIGKIGMYHIVIDLKNDKIDLNDIVEIDIKPIYVNIKIRREYVNE